jgi:hypothetical protein
MNNIEFLRILIPVVIIPAILCNYILHYKYIACHNRVIIISIIWAIMMIYSIATGKGPAGFKHNKLTSFEIHRPGCIISIWTITHFMCWVLVGLACPNVMYLAFIIAIIWEVLELIFEYDKQVTQSELLCKYINDCSKQPPISKELFWKQYFGQAKPKYELFYCSGGFYGQLLDMVVNTMGFMTGAYLHTKYM